MWITARRLIDRSNHCVESACESPDHHNEGNTMRIFAPFAFMTIISGAPAAFGCDELVSRLLTKAIQPSIESLGCGALGRAGVDKAEHRLRSVCYSSSGANSNVEIIADLTCKTSDQALIRTQVSERVKAIAGVRAADCSILDLKIEPAGDIGKILISAFGVEGKARVALQNALRGTCS
jgi:hypothetical protein